MVSGLSAHEFLVGLLLVGCLVSASAQEFAAVQDQKEVVKEMFYHAYNNYLDHAFPRDELKPISCTGHDTLGGYTLTLFDALDTLAVLQNKTEFTRVVNWISENVSFDRQKTVSVFETNIRVLGGLISGHMLAANKELDLMPGYKGQLLKLAKSLGKRLLKAFKKSPIGIPFGSVNLKSGVHKLETSVSATATGGTILLEFGLLSNLTGDRKYMDAAMKATRGLWDRRSSLDLMGSHIDVKTGAWVYMDSGVAGGIDSLFEYLLKAYLMFGDPELLEIFDKGYAAIIQRVKKGPWYPDVHMSSGETMFPYYRSLQSFWPGLQVLYGDLDMAKETFKAMHTVWKEHGFVPEALHLGSMKPQPGMGQYPLRPELAESAFYLWRATGDPYYRLAGQDIIESLNKHARVPCGFAAVENVTTKELRDHMDSYFLAETVKYLYLLFDDSPETAVFRDPTRYIFNTEAHLLPLPSPPDEQFTLLPGRKPDLRARRERMKAYPGQSKQEPKKKRGKR
mmetsp:Transcript_34240/g.78128  ORF Transcript_34240/g.78128 Transcript_34240/m.78128 type:complete len:509 (-) Transcript_34240:63-1589(-)